MLFLFVLRGFPWAFALKEAMRKPCRNFKSVMWQVIAPYVSTGLKGPLFAMVSLPRAPGVLELLGIPVFFLGEITHRSLTPQEADQSSTFFAQGFLGNLEARRWQTLLRQVENWPSQNKLNWCNGCLVSANNSNPKRPGRGES